MATNYDNVLELNHTRLIPATKWSKYHEWPSIGGLRHLIFNKDENGFYKVVRKAGYRVLIDERKFFEWIEEQNARETA
ncbi:Uncharacterized protein SCG7109_AB_00310 [Chlamydiales bacterium SCGC AG-110-M15]|nr:Uncharacterized protein SCG7109_AB_00310 [Chlamydiales bacterium SCGC AG-110-M15]